MRVGASHKDISLCEDFFRYFILARQLSDDAWDWKEDSGITNATLIVKLLEDVFEEKVKYEVAAEILKRSRQAIEKARGISCFNDTGLLEELPRYYEKMADRILKNIPER
jgi:geranylgeranyl pyrophosphate synthase